MTKTLAYKIPFIIIIFGFAFVVPFLAFAQTQPDISRGNLPNVWDPATLGSRLLVCGGVAQTLPDGSLLPSCNNLCNLVYQVLWIVYLAIAWVIWAIAPLSFVAGGIMYMFAGANPNMVSSAHKVLLGAVIGVAIVLSSYIIINTVVGFFHITHLGGFGTPACTP